MGFRFRKSIRIMPGLRVNLSAGSRGITTGLSVGGGGARFSVNSRGEKRTTYSLPGTGISHRTTTKLSGAGNADTDKGAAVHGSAHRVLFWLGVSVVVLGCAWVVARDPPRTPLSTTTEPALTPRIAIVSASSLRCRAIASTTAPVVTGFPRGTPVKILQATSGWTQVAFEPQQACWVASRYLSDPAS